MAPDMHVERPDNRYQFELNDHSDGKQMGLSLDRANREVLAFHGQQHRAARLTGIAPTREGVPPECLMIVRLLEGNDTCMDRNPLCHQGGLPEYAAVEFGIVLCRRCAFRHLDRNREGLSIKNMQFDQWKLSEVLSLLEGGNGNYEKYFNTQSPRSLFRRKDDNVASPDQMLDRRYAGKLATTYKQQLLEKVRKAYSDREQLIQLYFLSQRGAQRRGRHDFESLNESYHSHSSMSDASTSDRSQPRSVRFGNLPDNPPQREYNGIPTTSKNLSPNDAPSKTRIRTSFMDPSPQPRSNPALSTQPSNEALSRVQLMQAAAGGRSSSRSLNGNGSALSSFTSLRSIRDTGDKPTMTRRVAASAAFAQYQRLTGK